MACTAAAGAADRGEVVGMCAAVVVDVKWLTAEEAVACANARAMKVTQKRFGDHNKHSCAASVRTESSYTQNCKQPLHLAPLLSLLLAHTFAKYKLHSFYIKVLINQLTNDYISSAAYLSGQPCTVFKIQSATLLICMCV